MREVYLAIHTRVLYAALVGASLVVAAFFAVV